MRIVSLLPSATEIVFALGLGEQLVGVTHECDWPPGAHEKVRLTSTTIVAEARPGESLAAAIDRQVRDRVDHGHAIYRIDEAALIALRPQLILTQELCEVCAVSSALLRATLASAGIDARVLSLAPTSLAEVWRSIGDVAVAAGVPDRAAPLLATFELRLDALRARVVGRRRPRTLVLEWTDPPMGSGHWTPELIEIAGGLPVLAWSGTYSRTIGWDELHDIDPEVVIVAPCGMTIDAGRRALDELDRGSAEWCELRARGARIVLLDGHHFVNRPGPRLVETAEHFAAAIGVHGIAVDHRRIAVVA